VRKVRDDSSIKGVVLRIDSPGGEVVASDEMWRELNLLSKKKPMVISMSDVAASGGYFMAMTGDPIVAYPQTETGSIGVVFGKPDSARAVRQAGRDQGCHRARQTRRHRLGLHRVDSRGAPDAARGIDESYHDFVGKVAAARHRKFDQIEPLAQGRVWLGARPRSNGLVDELGGLDTAIDMVKAKAKIPASERVNVVMYPGRRSILDMLMHRPTMTRWNRSSRKYSAGAVPRVDEGRDAAADETKT
jgi:protease IV